MKGTMTAPILPAKILQIENDPATADQIRAALAGAGNGSFDVEWVCQLSVGLARLSKKEIAAILLELSWPDSHGIETFDKLFTAAPDVPILILGGNVNEALAKEAVGRGAQDHPLPAHLDDSLPRALRNAIERKAVEDALCVEKERAVALNSIGDAVLCTDISGNSTYSDGFVTAFLRDPKKRSRIMRWFSERFSHRNRNLGGSRSGPVRLSRDQSAANGVASLVSEYGSQALAIGI
jgi:CheY-like chemotaxis protein